MNKDKKSRVFSMANPKERIKFDGERCTPWVRAQVFSEHLHRYLSVIEHCQSKSVLDIACGEGYGSALIEKNGASQVVGVDISQDIVERAQRIYGNEQLSFKVGNLCDPLEFADNAFDVITCFETIEHISKHEEAMDELARVLKPGGLLVISTPEKSHPASVNSSNPFHEKELYEHEFVELVEERLPFVKRTYQRFFSGSVIVSEDQRFSGREEFWDRQNFLDFRQSEFPALLRYVIIWASEKDFLPPKTGLLHDRALGEVLIKAVREFGAD